MSVLRNVSDAATNVGTDIRTLISTFFLYFP